MYEHLLKIFNFFKNNQLPIYLKSGDIAWNDPIDINIINII